MGLVLFHAAPGLVNAFLSMWEIQSPSSSANDQSLDFDAGGNIL